MKYCIKCGRELFDRDTQCDKCGNKNLMNGDDVDQIIKEFSTASKLKKRIMLQDDTKKSIYEKIINKPKDNYRIDLGPHNNGVDFQRIKAHTLNPTPPAPVVTCPYCHSTNTKKISAGHRWLSTGLFGLASSDLGKQWKCMDCGSKF